MAKIKHIDFTDKEKALLNRLNIKEPEIYDVYSDALDKLLDYELNEDDKGNEEESLFASRVFDKINEQWIDEEDS